MTDGRRLAVSGSLLHDRRVDITVPDCGGNPVIEAAFRRHLQGQAGVFIHHDRPEDADALARRIGDVTTVLQFFSARPLSAGVLEASSAKRIIVAGPIGASVDLEAARRRNMAVYETPGLASASVAEYTIALALALGRRMTDGCLELRSGRWHATFGRGLFGKTVGIVGLGRVGGRVADLCKAFSARVLAWSPSLTDVRAAELGVRRTELDELAAGSDVISLHMRLSPTTKGLFDARLIDLMRPTAFLINTARAGLVDGEALRQALSARRIAGAALDVFDDEPIGPGSPWLQTDNVLLSPHMAWMSEEALEAFVGAAVDFAIRGDESRVRRVV
ncbi:D-2-hydroxyacid dehydrogenase family protein [Bradyrhizobium ontarionense]|uniref:D-2-hydroxyacid dehydrogenase family protein n=1 Tax=Bradyrhizobium ontarionense TaxID=2898149 RepID=A0ABY3RII6_9BRAD|nr:NAD(P)-dependent oxidoreductase [Bradyrhizobium sp. A19]UFZ06720.1 D-2-hydroxyacid dehydrogenase family protein [Bradyrhizobium sp. A19]